MVTTSWTEVSINSLLRCHDDSHCFNEIAIPIIPAGLYPKGMVFGLFARERSLNAHSGIIHDVLNVKFVHDVLNVIT